MNFLSNLRFPNFENFNMNKNQIVGTVFIGIGVLVLIIVGYHNSSKANTPLVFSSKDMLTNIWLNYKVNYIEPTSGRTLDKDNNNITTSEGESYTMLRSVWMDDQTTFDKSLNFVQTSLKRPDDHLASWLYGTISADKYGVLTAQGGQNTASDADTDIALALILASHRWNNGAYLSTAQDMLNDIWNEDVFMAAGKPYMGADNFEHNSVNTAVVNPSYFAPYAYRIFATVDKKHDWLGLVDTSYTVIQQSASSTLDKKTSDGLPPNWILINKATGKITPSTASNLDTNYGFDALRTPWRIALDWQWYKDPRAEQTLKMFSFLSTEWQAYGDLNAVYSHDGLSVQGTEAPAMYGGAIGYFMVADQKDAKDVYQKKLVFLYSPDTNSWKKTLSYYDDNWAWFGIALYNNLLPNFAKK